MLIERQANLEARDQQGNTALLLAAAGGFTSMVELLQDRGADLLATNTRGGGARAFAALSSGTTNRTLKDFKVPTSFCPKSEVPRGVKNGLSQQVRAVRAHLHKAVNATTQHMN